jgi:S-layer family protein
VNNRDCGYSLRVVFVPADVECRDLRLQVHKMQVSWIRQVSPAPNEATFADVPTGHPQFQFVEALAKSGITGGCGNGNFCPGAPLTRGQMSVFLAKGLGLAWP